MKKVGVVLSGCGVLDGSEIHEAVLTLLYLTKAGADVHCFAPAKPQCDVVNHLTQQPTDGARRNVLEEAARITRGNIKPLSQLAVDEFDAVVFPGGYGAAKNLSAFASSGPKGAVDPDVARVIQQAHSKGKVIGAICIAPVVIAKALEGNRANPRLTVGNSQDVQDALAAMNACPVAAGATEVVVDQANQIVSTPAYMLATGIADVATGIEGLVAKVMELA